MSGDKKRRASWCGRNAKKGQKKAEQAEQVLYDTVKEETEVKRSLQKELGAADVDPRPEDILAIPREAQAAGEFWEICSPIRKSGGEVFEAETGTHKPRRNQTTEISNFDK